MLSGLNLDIWGKLGSADSRQVHPLICHLLDTGHVVAALWDSSIQDAFKQWLAGAFGLEQGHLRRWLPFWGSLHDIGKAAPAFQIKAAAHHAEIIDRLKADGFRFGRANRAFGHDLLGKVILTRLFSDGRARYSVDRRLGSDLATVLSGHHGVFPLAAHARNVGPRQVGRHNWIEQQDALAAMLGDHWLDADLPLPSAPQMQAQAAYMAMAGLISVADWIASCEDYFPYAGRGIDLETYVSQLPQRAGAALERAGWTLDSDYFREVPFEQLFGFAPNALQRAVRGAAEHLSSPSLVLVEGPTGMGKTEAAFQLVQDFGRRLGHQGAYLALPTQATSNQMFLRFMAFLEESVVADRINLQLMHGQAMLFPAFEAIRPSNLSDTADTDSSAPDGHAGIRAQEWFLSSKRKMLAPFGVGTVDQGLLGILQTRHGFVRLFGLANKVVVLDEVHAYDVYTSRLLEHLLRWLAALNCSVVLLSATLPHRKRRELVEAFCGAPPELPDVAYPRVICANSGHVEAVHFETEEAREVHVTPIPDPPPGIARRLHDALSGGGCAVCICNTVRRAQDLYSAVREQFAGNDCEIDLLHSRFPFGRRREIEESVVRHFGKAARGAGQRPGRAVLVATQIVEQSLDLDFDLMVTDLAPVDLVLQRAGRLHRHTPGQGATDRPSSLATPQLWIAEPQTPEGAVPSFGASEWVYERYLLLRSYLCLLRERGAALKLPDDVERLIEQVYDNGDHWALDAVWRDALAEARAKLEDARGRDGWLATSRLIPNPDASDGVLAAFNRELPEDESLATQWSIGGLTRKALPSIRLICLHQQDDQCYLDRDCRRRVDLDRAPDHEALRNILDNAVALSHPSVVKGFNIDRPAPWEKAPILRNCFPLFLRDGRAAISPSLSLELDEELGIVIHRSINGPTEN